MDKTDILKELDCSEEELSVKLKVSQQKTLNKSRERRKTKMICSFEELSKNIPEEGAILEGEERGIIRVFEDWKKQEDGSPSRILYCHAKIDSKATGWYLHSKDYGLKCMISLRSSHRILEGDSGIFVRTLRVLRKSNSGKSIICEAME